MKKFTFLFVFAITNLFVGVAYAQIKPVVGSPQTNTTNSTSLSINKPSGVAIGDVMLVTIIQSGDQGAISDDPVPTVDTWNMVAASNSNSGGEEYRTTLFYRIVDGTEGASFSFTLDPQSEDGEGGLVAFTNVDVTGGFDQDGNIGGPFDVDPGNVFTNLANDATLNASSISTNTVQAAVIMFGFVANNNSISSWSITNIGNINELFDIPFNANEDMNVGAAWGIKNTSGATGAGTATLSGADRNGAILIALKPANSIIIPGNLWATSSNGTQVSTFAVNDGINYGGPTNLFTPTFPGTTTGGTSTAALGRNAQGGTANGFFYWLPNTSGNSGVVEVFASTAVGGSQTLIGSIDLNGGSTNNLGFVRLGMNSSHVGWILAGDGSNLYLAKFTSNGVNPVVITTVPVSLSGGAVSTFQNGDLCVSGNNNMYALANDGSGVTQIFIGSLSGGSVTLTKKWDLEEPNGDPFNGRVNGVAFDGLGSLYLSTDDGLYYVDQFTVNGPAGTVQCDLVTSVTGLQDLASNVFPSQSTLPVTLISFNGSLHNQVTTLNWVTENISNFDRFEIERSSNGSSFSSVGLKYPSGDPATRTSYTHYDNLAGVSGNVFYYRLKMIDADGQYKYSNVILVRKDIKGITGIVLNPNPVRDNTATLRFDAEQSATVEIRIMDLSGKLVLKQQNQVYKGTNSVSVGNLGSLQPGTYLIQLQEGGNVQTTKFIIAR